MKRKKSREFSIALLGNRRLFCLGFRPVTAWSAGDAPRPPGGGGGERTLFSCSRGKAKTKAMVRVVWQNVSSAAPLNAFWCLRRASSATPSSLFVPVSRGLSDSSELLGLQQAGRAHTFAHTLPTAGRRRLWSEEGQAVVLPLRDDVAQGVVVPSLARRRRRPRRSRGPGSSLAP